MSKFLGHIHYWLFNKIKRVIEREQLVYTRAADRFADAAEELQAQVWQTYGQPLVDVDLTDVIDEADIHGWLQRQINTAETREAAFIKGLTDRCGAAGLALAAEAYDEHGQQCGRHAKAQSPYLPEKAAEIYKTLQDYYLNGMPCDQAETVIENTPDKLVWEEKECLQERNWRRAGTDTCVMKGLYTTWLSGFVQALNPQFFFMQTGDPAGGASANRYQISREGV